MLRRPPTRGWCRSSTCPLPNTFGVRARSSGSTGLSSGTETSVNPATTYDLSVAALDAGTAVVWYHELGRSRAVDPLAWHAGCFVRGSSGVTRWGMQKFKEHPTGAATPDAFYEAMEAHVAAFEAMEVDAVAHAAAETSASRVSRAVPVGTGGRSDT